MNTTRTGPLRGLVAHGPDGSATVRVSDIVRVVEAQTGLVGGYLDMTGGNCGAVRWNLDGGAYLLITDGDVFTYSSGDRQHYCAGWAAGVYPSDDDSEPVGMGITDRTDTTALLGCVTSALRANGEQYVA